jgi:hypothetical protein
LVFQPSSGMPALVRQNIERCVTDAVAPLGLRGGGGWNELFWAVQPSGCAIWDGVEAGLALEPEKLMYGEPARAEGVRLQVWRVDAIRAGRAQAAACWRWMGRRAGGRDDAPWALGRGSPYVETMVLRAASSGQSWNGVLRSPWQ